MNIDAYNTETLRDIVRKLEKENNDLKEQLRKLQIPFESENPFDENQNDFSYDDDQGGRIIPPRYIDDRMVDWFIGRFHGRFDVYARRGKNGGYFPQCFNRWKPVCPKNNGLKQNCNQCENRQWIPLDARTVRAHLLGYKEDCSDVIGIYPLLDDQTCNFLVFDFDNHIDETDDSWKNEVDALRKICLRNGMTPLVERSRSGKGAHLWLFFAQPISARKARNFGMLLLEKGASEINLKSFTYYDRMFPSQDTSQGIGNLVALPLQGRALLQGNSAFVDENWNAYANQWDILLRKTKRLYQAEIDGYMQSWQEELNNGKMVLYAEDELRPKPWKQDSIFYKEDVNGKLHITLSDGIYVDVLNVMPRLQNQIRCLAAFDNPEYYKNKRLGYSNYATYSVVYLGKDIDGYIKLPRGLKEKLFTKCHEANIEIDVQDEQVKGRPIRVSFVGTLHSEQEVAVERLLHEQDGILNAATAFGKTVVCNYLIAQRKVSTLIILQSHSLLNQWYEKLKEFLNIDEPFPQYETKTGKKKQRTSLIGILMGSKNTLTGIVDIAMAATLANREDCNEILNQYGMIIVDECHHAASTTYISVLQEIKSKYIYGFSATLKRSDKLDQIIPWMIGPIRHKYTSFERVQKQGIPHHIIPRFTKVVDSTGSIENINEAYELLRDNKMRNQMIVEDARDCIALCKKLIILTRFKNQAKTLYDLLRNTTAHVFLIYGDNSDKQNDETIQLMNAVKDDEAMILIATGQKIGEGFDYKQLDTLLLATPVAHSGMIEQYIGRIDRTFADKKEVLVYDYVDSHIYFFNRMYQKRLKTYKKIGFTVLSETADSKHTMNAIFDRGNYQEPFEQDLISANHSIVISSPSIRKNAVDRFINVITPRLEKGVNITIITLDPDENYLENVNTVNELLKEMKDIGIHIVLKNEIYERFAVIDQDLVWHGGMNLLGKTDVNDNLIRIYNNDVASELLELSFSKSS